MKKWYHDNQMAANGDKTKVILVTTYQKEATPPVKELTVYYDNNSLKSVDSKKNPLGVKIGKHLTWKEHVNQTAKTISRTIALLRRIRAYLPHQTRITFYKAYIQPHTDYCNTVWDQSTPCAQNPHSSKNAPQTKVV